MNLEKTEVMWIGEQEVDLHVVVDGKAIKKLTVLYTWVVQCVRMEEVSSKEILRRVQAGAAAWRRVEGIMWDRKLKKQLKGKVLEACVVPACIYGLGTLALTERQEEKIQIAENNWVQTICQVTQEDRMKMKECADRTCAKNGRRKTVKKRMESRGGGRRRRGRPKLRDLERAGMNGQKWKTVVRQREMERINNERRIYIYVYNYTYIFLCVFCVY